MKLSDIVVGESDPTRKVFRQIRKIAGSNKDALIVGEAGVGKSTIAYAIHESTKGSQAKGFVTVSSMTTTDDELRKFVSGESPVLKGGTVLFEEVDGFTFLSQLQIVKFLEERKSKLGVRVVCTVTDRLESLGKIPRLDKHQAGQNTDYQRTHGQADHRLPVLFEKTERTAQ